MTPKKIIFQLIYQPLSSTNAIINEKKAHSNFYINIKKTFTINLNSALTGILQKKEPNFEPGISIHT